MANYSRKDTETLFEEIKQTLASISYGSIEIYIQDNKVTQITVRNIKKTSLDLSDKRSFSSNKQSLAPPGTKQSFLSDKSQNGDEAREEESKSTIQKRISINLRS